MKTWISMALGLACWLAAWPPAVAAAPTRGEAAKVVEWTVDGVKREALVHGYFYK